MLPFTSGSWSKSFWRRRSSCACVLCFLSVSGSVHGFRVHFRSSLDPLFIYSWIPLSCDLDAIRFFTSDTNLEDWMEKFHSPSQGPAVGSGARRGAFCAACVPSLLCWHSAPGVWRSSWLLPCSPAGFIWEKLRPVMGKAGLNGLCLFLDRLLEKALGLCVRDGLPGTGSAPLL